MSTLIVLLVCAIVAGAYTFLGKMKLDQAVREARRENDELTARLDQISQHAQMIPVLAAKQPEWLYALELFRDAIPHKVDDDKFFGFLANEMQRNNVEFLGVEVAPGGQWLGKLKASDREELVGIGVDVEAATQMRVSYYTVRLLGDYNDVLTALENLKRYRRLYTIDQITSPAGGGPGTITVSSGYSRVPIEVSGKMFFGIPKDHIDGDQLIEQIVRSLVSAKTVHINQTVQQRGQMLLPQGDRKARFEGGRQEGEAAPEKQPVDVDTQTSQAKPGATPVSRPARPGNKPAAAGS
jgi:hypothetical protein